MAEFCLDCFNKFISARPMSEDEVELSSGVDICEGCGDVNHIVLRELDNTEVTIKLYPGMSVTPVKITIQVPVERDKEEYIDEYLDGLLSDFVRYNCEWEFI